MSECKRKKGGKASVLALQMEDRHTDIVSIIHTEERNQYTKGKRSG